MLQRATTDQLGSVTQVIDGSANVVWSSEYQPFGKTAGVEGLYDFDGSYAGHQVDKDTGLIYSWNRWMDPDTGRFVSEDPAQDGVNFYAYVGNSPEVYVDPDGQELVAAAVGFFVGAATEIGLEAAENVVEGRNAFDNLNIGEIAVSAGVGAFTGATGLGLISQARKIAKTIKAIDKAAYALQARKIAMAAGKIRNAAENAKLAATVADAQKSLLTTVALTGAVVAAKKGLKAAVAGVSGQHSWGDPTPTAPGVDHSGTDTYSHPNGPTVTATTTTTTSTTTTSVDAVDTHGNYLGQAHDTTTTTTTTTSVSVGTTTSSTTASGTDGEGF